MPYNDITTIQNPVTHNEVLEEYVRINETDEWLRVHGGGE